MRQITASRHFRTGPLAVCLFVCLVLGAVSPLLALPVPAPRALYDAAGEVSAEPPAVAGLSTESRALLARLLGEVESTSADRAVGSIAWLTILVEFDDVQFPDTYTEDFDPKNLLGWPDSVVVTPRTEWFENILLHVDEYYRSVSGDALSLNSTLWSEPVRLADDMGVYGDEELPWVHGVRLLAAEVVDSLDTAIDFSAYDLVSFIHAGSGQESDLLRDSPEQIWSGYVDYESLTEAFIDSVYIDDTPEDPDDDLEGWPGIDTEAGVSGSFILQRFGLLPEKEVEEDMDPDYLLGELGVYVHQIGSYIGLLSLNDYRYPQGQGAGNFDLMSSGLWNALGFVPGPPSAFNRMVVGWVDAPTIESATCFDPSPDGGLEFAIHSFEQAGDVTLFKFPISDREYFLIENRNQDADDSETFTFSDDNENHVPDNGESLLGAEFDYFTTQSSASDTQPGSGLFIWRIDEEMIHLTFQYNTNLINAYNDHYGVKLLEADGYPDLSEPGFGSDSYGGDYDAFRSGENGLPRTPTAIDVASYPNTRSADGADSGWRFHSIGGHGQVMDFSARWSPSWEIESLLILDLLPAGEPVLCDLCDDAAGRPEFAFVAECDADSIFVFMYRDGVSLASIAPEHPRGAMLGLAGGLVGSPAAGDLNGDGFAELVLLKDDGDLFAWTCVDDELVSLAGGDPDTPLLTGLFSLASPLLCDIDGPPGDSSDPALEIIVAQHIPGDEATADNTRIRCFDEDGTELTPSAWPEAQATMAGALRGDLALGFELPPTLRGYDHPAPDALFLNTALVDTIGVDSGQVWRLALRFSDADPDWAPLERTLAFIPFGDDAMRLRSGDLDGDGNDELLVEAEGRVLLWYPAGRFAGENAGAELFVAEDLPASTSLALSTLDLNGDGTLEATAALPGDFASWSADAALLPDWSTEFPQTEPNPGDYADPALWSGFRRDSQGRDRPLVFTRDGRLFDGLESMERGEAVLLGGNLTGRPQLCLDAAGEVLELHGLSAFEPISAATASEDTLLYDRLLRYWWSETDWSAEGAAAWLDLANDPSGSGRSAAANSVTLSASAAGDFAEAYAYPNPAGDSVTWRVRTEGPDSFTIELFDLEGQKRLTVRGVSDGLNPWERESRLVGLASGVYLYTIISDGSGAQRTGRLVIIR